MSPDVDGVRYTDEEIIRMATEDAVMGIDSRQHFDKYAPKFVETAQASNKPLAAVMVDIDNMRDLNSKYGHVKTDKILREIAQTLKKNLHSTDKIARYGGDEIVLLLPETNLKGGSVVANRLVKTIRELSKIRDLKISISAGSAQADLGSDNIHALLEKADKAVYEAKKTRDRNLTFRPGLFL